MRNEVIKLSLNGSRGNIYEVFVQSGIAVRFDAQDFVLNNVSYRMTVQMTVVDGHWRPEVIYVDRAWPQKATYHQQNRVRDFVFGDFLKLLPQISPYLEDAQKRSILRGLNTLQQNALDAGKKYDEALNKVTEYMRENAAYL